MNMTVRMVLKRVYPRALRLAAWKRPLIASRKLAGVDPGEDALEMIADHLGNLFHRLDLRAQYIAPQAIEEPTHDVRLLAGESVPQLLAIMPGTRGARSGHVREQPVELGALRGGELAAVLQQHPAQIPSGSDRASARSGASCQSPRRHGR